MLPNESPPLPYVPVTAKTVLANYGPACTIIIIQILRALTINLTRARARAMARARALARTRDSLGLGLGLWLALGLGLRLGSVFTFKRPDRFCRRTKFNVTYPQQS